MLKPEQIDVLWKFVRGDLTTKDFEQWLYSTDGLDRGLGAEKHLELISANLKDKEAIFSIKKKLLEYLENSDSTNCFCIRQPNISFLGMSPKNIDFMQSLPIKSKRGGPHWWLAMRKCSICKTAWLYAEESQIHDNLILKRLSPEQEILIIEKEEWPPDFDSYQSLLEITADKGFLANYIAPLDSDIVATTVEELVSENNDIKPDDLARIFNVSKQDAEMLLFNAKKKHRKWWRFWQ